MMELQWWNTDLHGKGVQGDRDWSVLSKPSSNFCEERQSSSKASTSQVHIPAKKTKQNSNHQQNFCFFLRQLSTLTLLIFGQLHGGVDVGGHLAGAEAAVLLAATVGVVALRLQTTWANTGSVNKGGRNFSVGSVQQRCFSWTDESFIFFFFTIWTSLPTKLLYGFIGIWRQPPSARLIESVAVDELWKEQINRPSNHSFVSICSCEQRWVCWGCWGVLSSLLRAPCSDKESSVPFFRNHCPSMLPVTEKAQQDPHMPCKRHTQYTQKLTPKNMMLRYVVLLFSFAAGCWYLILHRTDGTVIPPIPAGGGGVLGRKGWFHWLVESPLTQEGVQVRGAKFFL